MGSEKKTQVVVVVKQYMETKTKLLLDVTMSKGTIR